MIEGQEGGEGGETNTFQRREMMERQMETCAQGERVNKFFKVKGLRKGRGSLTVSAPERQRHACHGHPCELQDQSQQPVCLRPSNAG